MSYVIGFIGENWVMITIIITIIASILNSITLHYGANNPRIVPLFAVIIEALSVIVSKGATNGSWGKFKLPGENVPPAPIVKKNEEVDNA